LPEAVERNLRRNNRTPATIRVRYVPHDCKQVDLLSGALKTPGILIPPVLCPTTNWEMVQRFEIQLDFIDKA
jgi:hypothetical protein